MEISGPTNVQRGGGTFEISGPKNVQRGEIDLLQAQRQQQQHHHHLSDAGFSSMGGGESMDFDRELTLSLSDRLKVFKTSNFEPEAYVIEKCRGMSEKEIRFVYSYLLDLKKASAEEMRKSVYANYAAFIRTAREISDLEGQLLSLRNFLSTQAALVHSLADGTRLETLYSEHERSMGDTLNLEDRELTETEKWLEQYMEHLEVLLAERRIDEALTAFEEGERAAKEAERKQTLSHSAILSLRNTIKGQRQRVADQLAHSACQSSTGRFELRSSVQAMKQLGDGPRAHSLLLNSHQHKLQYNMQGIRHSGSVYGAAYTAALSQLVFSTIAQASSDSLAVFGDEPAYTSELVTWAVKQTELFSLLVKRHVLASSAAAGSLRVVAECVQICMGHCSMLEARGLSLSPVLLKLFRPCVEQALSANLKRIEHCTAALAAADDWSLSYPPVATRPLGSSSLGSVIASQPKLSSSAHRFNSLVQEICEDIGSLESLQYADSALEGVLQVFNSYINMLVNALPASVDTENLEGSVAKLVRMAESESQQIALLANAMLLAEELLPRAASKLSSASQASRMDQSRIDATPRRTSDRQNRAPEQRELKKRLQRLVDRLRDGFCRQHALEIIFSEDGGVRLGSEMYTSLDGSTEPEWFPSSVYQDLYEKLTLIASIASEVFVGRERFATMLLMRLTETVILWLSDDQNFWEAIETGPRPLGPQGLQQFYLDMEFVILFASQGRYLSRNLHQVIKNIIGRAIEAVSASGTDPYSVLPEEDWFAEVAQIAIKTLTGKANFRGDDDAPMSPTAFVSENQYPQAE